MESLENKLDRLSPEQRKEIEDFVDFLLSRPGRECPNPPDGSIPLPVLDEAPPLLAPAEPPQTGDLRQIGLQEPVRTGNRGVLEKPDEAVPVPFQEIGGGIQDRITHDYMDYGQFEHQSSPAMESVHKVRRKIIARQEKEKPRHLLDWVD